MKRLLIYLVLISVSSGIFAQAPQKMSYQCIVRNATGALIINKNVGLRTSILQGTATGTVVYQETYSPLPKTNASGLLSIEIGGGVPLAGKVFSAINWGAGQFYLKTETDPAGGTNYTIIGTSQLLSVPYALYSKTAGNEFSSDLLVNGLTVGRGKGALVSNTADGYQALYSNTTGFENTAIGFRALNRNISGNSNTASGLQALYNNTTGNSNTANGTKALVYNTTGSYNTANGYQALYSNTTGNNNAANGYQALFSNTTGNYNTSNGFQALYSNTTGSFNSAIGYWALYYNTTGTYNTANGDRALYRNSTGYENVANGCLALWNNSTGNGNVANGVGALHNNTTGNFNTANGRQTLYCNTTGSYNTASGKEALYYVTTGSQNTALGGQAGSIIKTGVNNTIIGYSANVTVENIGNATAIGYNAIVNASNKIVLGNPNAKTVGGYGAWTNYSDLRLKENIVYKNDLGLNFITRLKPVSFNYKANKNKDRTDGLIAQDVEQVLKELNLDFSGLIIDDDNDKTMNLSYPAFVIPLITAVQEQQKQIEAQQKLVESQQKQIEELKAQQKLAESQQKQIDELKKLVGMLSQK